VTYGKRRSKSEADPDAEQSFRRIMQAARRGYNQEFWWKPEQAVTAKGGDRTSIYRTVSGGFWPKERFLHTALFRNQYLRCGIALAFQQMTFCFRITKGFLI